MRVQHNEIMTWKCNYCPYQSPIQGNLKKHYSRTHKISSKETKSCLLTPAGKYYGVSKKVPIGMGENLARKERETLTERSSPEQPKLKKLRIPKSVICVPPRRPSPPSTLMEVPEVTFEQLLQLEIDLSLDSLFSSFSSVPSPKPSFTTLPPIHANLSTPPAASTWTSSPKLSSTPLPPIPANNPTPRPASE